MFKWLKDWWQECEQHNTDLHFKCDVPMPEVKPCKGSNISEPVHAMLKAWKDNPKRFKLSLDKSITSLWSDSIKYHSYYSNPETELTITDREGKETFRFTLSLTSGSCADGYKLGYYKFISFANHRIYPVLGSSVISKPAWMTDDEMDYIIKTVTPYYLKRVNRYRDIIESRMDRSRKASELKSEITKQKERQRLCEIYK